MTTITKARIELFIKNPLDNGLTRGEQMEVARIALASLGAEPVSQTYNFPELIEGMEVSIDVSTCDADLGNRYFGIVTEALELDTAKNGYILPVQDAEPNFDINGNSPVTPDGWISCSERMPEETGDIIVVSDGIVMSGISYSRRDGFYIAALEYDDDEPIGGVTHWMPLPEPPQEVNRG
ncbi:Protein of uncharacterised function (DUF551) [Klebsiella pneumoniae]|nr:DUF551 domain-containing protein [Klebsiella pneumoniae]SLR39133.1 Protein of uncharacterised function (DUF551) [Klebsiella pneumoniae]SLT29161.1 Protein of uncharacterised function (DUF551) [Klebsiella pneumoniae]SLT30665.1 Protein of uncharacterised function (DUF551) [Klebsiella pneumoniae]SLT63511.1 Protein of uncharacterised function (DUF551) [Klebsiella pneumoniae]SLT78355.1 Protein of uncharacterised function (DUF551) [Klebsiella pneumoniae]